MDAGSHPESIDSRLVFRVYAWISIASGLFLYAWGVMWLASPHFPGLPWGKAALVRTIGAIFVASGCCAIGFASVGDSIGRARALLWFAAAHLAFGVLFVVQWLAILITVLPPFVGWSALIVGVVLLYLAATGPGGVPRPSMPPLEIDDQGGTIRRDRRSTSEGEWSYQVTDDSERPARLLRLRSRRSVAALRSQYEEQIRQAARQEERARLARDLHDAVKQQIFVMQTAAATAQTRFDADPDGAKAAIDQVRTSAREAMTEMEAMVDQLQAAPLEINGLIGAIRKQAEALGFRTGAQVDVDLGELPVGKGLTAFRPAALQTVLRVAQEALANVGRHARARSVHVSLGLISGHLVLTVRDDGSGFEVGHRRGMGLENMAARAAEVGGDFEVVSTIGQGTVVRFTVPYENPTAADYRKRALAWAIPVVVATLIAFRLGAHAGLGMNVGVLAAMLASVIFIGAIAVVRYTVASHRASRTEGVS